MPFVVVVCKLGFSWVKSGAFFEGSDIWFLYPQKKRRRGKQDIEVSRERPLNCRLLTLGVSGKWWGWIRGSQVQKEYWPEGILGRVKYPIPSMYGILAYIYHKNPPIK